MPSPSWPSSLCPQQCTVPAGARTQAWRSIDLGGGPATAANFATDLFYARVTPKGDVSATTQLGVESYAEVRPRAHRIGPAGQRVTVGTFTGTVDFGAGPMTSGDEGEVFLRVAP